MYDTDEWETMPDDSAAAAIFCGMLGAMDYAAEDFLEEQGLSESEAIAVRNG